VTQDISPPGADLVALAEGAYEVFHQGQPCGGERWRIVRSAGRLAAAGEIVMRAPFPYPSAQRYQVSLTADWRVLGLEIDWKVGLKELLAVHRAEGDRWKGRVTYDEQTREQEGNYPHGAEVDYGSPLFTTFTLLRRGFGPGTDEEFPVLSIGPPFMAVTPDRQRYRFAERGEVATPAGRFAAWRWLLTHPERPGDAGRTFWTDTRGVVVESYEDDAPGRVWMRLVEYRIVDDAWGSG
jgi:hypothetical protein